MLNQKWFHFGNQIISKGIQTQADQSKCIDVFDSNVHNGANVGVFSRHGGLNQLWNIEKRYVDESGTTETISTTTTLTTSAIGKA